MVERRCVFSNSFYFRFQALKNLYKIHWFKCTGAKLLQSPITNYLQITQVLKRSFQFYQKQFTFILCLKRFYFVNHKFHLCLVQLFLLIFLVTLTIFHFPFCTVRVNLNLSLSNFYSFICFKAKKNFRSEQFYDDRYF